MIPWLEGHQPFPPVESALRDPNGLLAASDRIAPERLLAAYRQGIFPWYAPGDPVLWWSPDPRMVLPPKEFRLARSLRKRLRRGDFVVTVDTAFEHVLAGCAATPRPGQDGTWIDREIATAYTALHELGLAHSVECWQTAEVGARRLVGGLYGVCLGRMFYGESMFSLVSDASKAAFAHLVRLLAAGGGELIDCQMKTAHLASLGGREIPRPEFQRRLQALITRPAIDWPRGELHYDW